jgi:peptidoglycan hydrolase-like protein with peptidoglycan-binding domain
MKVLLSIGMFLLVANTIFADDLTRAVQQRLKDQGFFYGSVNGQEGSETSAAIRRFQIRYGLKVTGQLDDATMRSMGLARNGSVPSPGAKKDWDWNQFSQQRPNDDAQANASRQYSQPDPNGQNYDDEMEPAPIPRSSYRGDSYYGLFAGTVYEHAPAQVQENVLVSVQGELSKKGLFRAVIDGQPGPSTSDAIARFQQREDLPVSGRLDEETLDALRALPGQRNGPPSRPTYAPRDHPQTLDGEPVYRGVPVE